MRIRWCCGYSLEGGVRILAWTDILVEIIGMAVNIESLVTNASRLTSLRNNEMKPYKYHEQGDRNMETGLTETQAIIAIVLVSLAILIHLTELLIVNVLMSGAKERDAQKCSIWNIATGTLTALDAALFIGHLVLEFDIWIVVFMIVNVIYKSYSVATVDAFRREVEMYGNVNRAAAEVPTN